MRGLANSFAPLLALLFSLHVGGGFPRSAQVVDAAFAVSAKPELAGRSHSFVTLRAQTPSSQSNSHSSLHRKAKLKSVRIRILEDVVRRVSDPRLQYHNKKATTADLNRLLEQLREDPVHVLQKSAKTEIAGSCGSETAINDALLRLRDARVIPVLRGNNAKRLIDRGLELSVMPGCRAIEVSVDCPEAFHVIRQLSSRISTTCMLGAATVMCERDFIAAADAGARFLTSPISPPGMVAFCEQRGILAIPAALTPSEIFTAISSGARAIKLFPAAAAMGPEGLRCMRGLKPFQKVTILASGGIGPSEVEAWLAAGADAVAVGTQLVGRDTTLASPPEGAPGREKGELLNEEEEWDADGRRAAMALFARVQALR